MIADVRKLVDAIEYVTRAIEGVSYAGSAHDGPPQRVPTIPGVEGAVAKLESARADLAALITATAQREDAG